MQIREERTSDQDAVYAVNTAAFPSNEEAELVNRLRKTADPIIFLVAERQGVVVGHILFTPVTLDSDASLNLMGLAPMAVLPDFQRHGIGSALIDAGLAQCQQLGVGAVVVLGHAEYYPKFGFVPSIQFGITSEYDVPDDVFMITELVKDYLRDQHGTIQYHGEFSDT